MIEPPCDVQATRHAWMMDQIQSTKMSPDSGMH